MADIKLVVKIPEEAYKLLKNKGVDWLGAEHILNAVANGIQIPKDHGKIVDIGKIDEDKTERDNPVICLTVNGEYIEAVSLDYLNGLPAIIDAEEKKEPEFHCGVEESGGHAYNCNDCPNKCEEWYQWDKEMKR